MRIAYVCMRAVSILNIVIAKKRPRDNAPTERAVRNATPRKVADEHDTNDVAATGSTCGTQDRTEDLRKIRRQSPSTPTMTPTDRLSTHTARLISGDYDVASVPGL